MEGEALPFSTLETGVDIAQAPLIAIVGPTASGKTAAAIQLAEKLNGEIICADSRTIYKGMDIGTAKPTEDERSRVPHWGIDLVEPDKKFTVADFKEYTVAKIADIRSRGKVPFLVGGSGLYIDAVLFDFSFGRQSDPQKRAYLEGLSIDELWEYCKKNNIELPENKLNKRYVIRAIERGGDELQRKQEPISTSFIVGIATEKDELRARIELRAEQIFAHEVVKETIELGEKYGWEHESMTGNIYPIVRKYLEGELTLQVAKREFTLLDWRLAKRQLTWFRRNPYIVWLLRDEVVPFVSANVVVP